ncbi:MAG: MerR family transcriptional regulator [Coriobacteriales bacterium]|nr:MerR family transcriptional regulator [Coriobacteriales bacterium]
MTGNDRNRPLYMISVAADLAGMHPQTLRVYENKGLVRPQRSAGNTRLYSQADIEQLELIGQLTAEGINLAGVMRIIDLQDRLEQRDDRIEKLQRQVVRLREHLHEYEMRQQITALVRVQNRAITLFDAADAAVSAADAATAADVAAVPQQPTTADQATNN